MFSFWVNDTTNFLVTQAWHLHTMPALIMVKYSFDYFTPFKTILWQFLSLESQLPGPLFPTFPPPLPVCTICCCQHLTVGAPLGTIQRPGMLAESGPSWPQVHLSQLLLKEIPVKLLLSPSLPSFFFFFNSGYWVKHFHLLYMKSFHSLFKTLRNKAIEKYFSKFLTHIVRKYQENIKYWNSLENIKILKLV